MFKDVFYILRSPLLIAFVAGAALVIRFTKIEGVTTTNLYFLMVPGLCLCYFLASNKIISLQRSHIKLPKDNKYNTILFYGIVCSFLSIPHYLLSGVLFFGLVISFYFWLNFTSIYIGIIAKLFENTIKLKELVLSLTITSWFILLAAVWTYHWKIGLLIGFGIVCILPWVITGFAGLLQRMYRLMNHEFYIYGREGGWVLNQNYLTEEEKGINYYLPEEELKKGRYHNEVIAMNQGIRKIQEEINNISKYDGDNRVLELTKTITKYNESVDKMLDFIYKHVSVVNARKLQSIRNAGLQSVGEMTFKDVQKESKSLLPLIFSILLSLNEGDFKMDSEAIDFQRYDIMLKLYNKAQGNPAMGIRVDTLSAESSIEPEELAEILNYWIAKKMLLKSIEGVQLTPFGVSEIKKTIEKPEQATENFPSNIIHNYHVQVEGSFYGNMQIGGHKNKLLQKKSHMGEKNINKGNAVSVGSNPNVHHNDIKQENKTGSEMDMEQLSIELSKLREYMAGKSTDAEHSIATGAIANAELAAKQKDSGKVTEYLKSAGKWAFEMATKIGVSLATDAIKKSAGL